VIKIGSDVWGFLEIRGPDGLWKYKGKMPGDRDYDWFGLLAGVRNHVNAKPIAELRGFPSDISPELIKKIASWDGLDEHSCSWLSLEDFSKYDWENVFIDGRMSTVDRRTGEELNKTLGTAKWSVESDFFEYKNLPRVAKTLMPKEWEKFLNKMELLATKYGPENVRIVFWFD
jgi:hypothetical protein